MTDSPEQPPKVTTPPQPFDSDAASPEAAIEEPSAVAADETPEPEVLEDQQPETPADFEDLSELPLLLEAILFVADHPIDVGYLARAVEVSVPRMEKALDELAASLREAKRGIRLQRGPEGVLLVSAPEAAPQVERFLGLEANRRLTTASLETLAIIAYRQPITRGQVDAIRGVSSDGAIATLRARDLIEPSGHAPGPGRPMLFRTTQRFLEHFGLERPGQLPALPDDIDLPPAEISEQLGLDEAAVLAALAAEAVAEEAPAEDVDIPTDVSALAEAAEHAFEASRERTEANAEADPDADEASDA